MDIGVDALEQISSWGIANVETYIESLGKRFRESLELKGYWMEEDKYRSSHLMSLRYDGEKDPVELAKRLREEGYILSVRRPNLRVSPHIYNNEDELLGLLNYLN